MLSGTAPNLSLETFKTEASKIIDERIAKTVEIEKNTCFEADNSVPLINIVTDGINSGIETIKQRMKIPVLIANNAKFETYINTDACHNTHEISM